MPFIALHHPRIKKNKNKKNTTLQVRQEDSHTYRNHDCIFSGEQAPNFSSALALHSAQHDRDLLTDDAHCHQLRISDRKLLVCNSRNKAVDEKAILSTSPHFSVFLGSQLRIVITSLKGPMPCQVAETCHFSTSHGSSIA